MATKTDLDQMTAEVKNRTKTSIEKTDKLGGRLFVMETETEKFEAEVRVEKKRIKTLPDVAKRQERIMKTKRPAARWNL